MNYERLSALDSAFLTFEHRHTHMHVGSVAIFDEGTLARAEGGIDFERIKAYIGSRLHKVPRYRQRIAFTPVERRPIWIDDEHFNLDYHVRHTSLPHPGSDLELRRLASRIFSQHLDREKPLWEMWIVEGLSISRFAIISKTHHCMVDGVSGMNLLSVLYGAEPVLEIKDPPYWAPRPRPGRLSMAFSETLDHLRATGEQLRAATRALIRPATTARHIREDAAAIWETARAGLHTAPETPLNGPVGPHRRFDWVDLDLLQIKKLRQELDASVNDLLLTVVTGAVRRYLQKRGSPTDIHYRIVVPVNVRIGDDVELTNKVSAWFIELPVGIRDPLECYAEIRDQTSARKQAHAADGIAMIVRAADRLRIAPLTRLGSALTSHVHTYNTVVTNVPGPRQPVYLLDARLEAMYPQLLLFERTGLGVAILSYCDTVFIGLTADWDLVPDLHYFAEMVSASFEELCKRVLGDARHRVDPMRPVALPSQPH